MKRPKVYITSRSFGLFSEGALELIKSVAEIERSPYDRAMNEEELLKVIGDIDGLIVGSDKINRKIIAHSKNLKVIAKHGVGIDNIDLKAATDNNIVVAYAHHANAESVADFTIGLILSIARHVPQAHFSIKRGMWEGTKFIGTEVYGKTIGIIGLGAIGERVAKRARGFDMRILAYDPYVSYERTKEIPAKLVNFDMLLKKSDFITLHVALTDETRGMIGEKEFALMKKTAYFINTARGPIVDEAALYKALSEKKIAGAAIDVFSKEPPSADSPLFRLDNVVLSPHIAAYTLETICRMDMMNAEDIVKFFRGENPRYVANAEVLDRISLK